MCVCPKIKNRINRLLIDAIQKGDAPKSLDAPDDSWVPVHDLAVMERRKRYRMMGGRLRRGQFADEVPRKGDVIIPTA